MRWVKLRFEVRVRQGRKFVALLAALTVVMVAPIFASHTEVNVPAAGEKSHTEILGDCYGGTFTGSGSDLGHGLWSIFSNEADVTAYRIDDYDSGGEGLGSTLDIVHGGVGDIDAFWSDGVATITVAALEAGHQDQTFGWNEGNGLNFVKIVAWGEDPVEFSVDSYHFLWADKVVDGGTNIWWSDEMANFDDYCVDHLVTYKIEGVTDPEYIGKTVWLLFWEDMPSISWDQDYNDFVIEIRTIPEPTTIALLGLGILGLLRRERT